MYDYKVPELSEQMREIEELARQIREKKVIIREEARINKASTKPVMPRTAGAKVRGRSVSRLKEELEELGVDMEDTENVRELFYFHYLSFLDYIYMGKLFTNLIHLQIYRHTSRKLRNARGRGQCRSQMLSDNVFNLHLDHVAPQNQREMIWESKMLWLVSLLNF